MCGKTRLRIVLRDLPSDVRQDSPQDVYGLCPRMCGKTRLRIVLRALPPDVRQGFALPLTIKEGRALPLVRPLA